MDGVIAALAGAAPQLGQIGVVVLVLGLLIRREVQTDKRHQAEVDRVNKARTTEVAAIQARLDTAMQKLDEERRARWAAEDAAAGRVRKRTPRGDGGGP